MLSPASSHRQGAPVSLPLLAVNLRKTDKFPRTLPSFPEKLHTVFFVFFSSSPPPLPPPLFVSPAGTFLTPLTQTALLNPSHLPLSLPPSLRDLDSQAGSHLSLSLHRSASPARWSSVGLQANVYGLREACSFVGETFCFPLPALCPKFTGSLQPLPSPISLLLGMHACLLPGVFCFGLGANVCEC